MPSWIHTAKEEAAATLLGVSGPPNILSVVVKAVPSSVLECAFSSKQQVNVLLPTTYVPFSLLHLSALIRCYICLHPKMVYSCWLLADVWPHWFLVHFRVRWKVPLALYPYIHVWKKVGFGGRRYWTSTPETHPSVSFLSPFPTGVKKTSCT